MTSRNLTWGSLRPGSPSKLDGLLRPRPSPLVPNSNCSAGRKLRRGTNQGCSTRKLDSPGWPRETPPGARSGQRHPAFYPTEPPALRPGRADAIAVAGEQKRNTKLQPTDGWRHLHGLTCASALAAICTSAIVASIRLAAAVRDKSDTLPPPLRRQTRMARTARPLISPTSDTRFIPRESAGLPRRWRDFRSRPVGRGLPVDEFGNAQKQVAVGLVSDRTAKWPLSARVRRAYRTGGVTVAPAVIRHRPILPGRRGPRSIEQL